MSYRRFVITAIAATLSLSALPSFAQSNGKHGNVLIIESSRDDRRDSRSDRRADRHDERLDQRHDRQADRRDDRRDRREARAERREDRRDDRRDRNDRRYQRDHDRRGPGYYYSARGPEFRRGHHLPGALRSPQYVVVNYRHHHLKAPPRGHQWVQVGADYVLVAVATGLIAHILLSH